MMSLQVLLQQLTSQPNIDKSTLIQIIHNLTERIDRLESNSSSLTTIHHSPPDKSYSEFIQQLNIPKLEGYLDNLPKLLTKILTIWLNKDKTQHFLD